MSVSDTTTKSNSATVGKASAWIWALPIAVAVSFVILATALWPKSHPFEVDPRLEVTGFSRALTSLAYSSDGKTVAVGGMDCQIRLLRAVDGIQMNQFASEYVEGAEIYPLIFTHDSQRLISANAKRPGYAPIHRKRNPVVKVWDIPTARLVTELKIADQGYHFNLLPDEKILSINVTKENADEHLQDWDLSTGSLTEDTIILAEPLETSGKSRGGGRSPLDLIIGGRVDCVVRSPDGKFIAVSGVQGSLVAVIDLATSKVTQNIAARRPGDFDDAAQRIDFSPDSRSLLVVKLGGIEFWDLVAGKRKWKVPYRGNFMSFQGASFSENGSRVALGGGSIDAGFWPETGRFFSRLVGRQPSYDWESCLLILNTDDGSIEHKITRRHFRAIDLCLTPDGNSIAVAGTDDSNAKHSVLIWDLNPATSSMSKIKLETLVVPIPQDPTPPKNSPERQVPGSL